MTGTLFLLQVSAASPFVNAKLDFTIPYFSISLAINLFVTIAIVSRLLLFRRRIASVLGPSHGTQYTSVAALIIESAALFSVFSVLFLVPFGLKSSIASISWRAWARSKRARRCSSSYARPRARPGLPIRNGRSSRNKEQGPRIAVFHLRELSAFPLLLDPSRLLVTRYGSLASSDYKCSSTILNGITVVKEINNGCGCTFFDSLNAAYSVPDSWTDNSDSV